jgi:putative addiction module CopG family antidote
MRKSKPISVTLTPELAQGVKDRVAAGAYASDSEVIRAGLRALFAKEEAEYDAAVEHWLRTAIPKRVKRLEQGEAKLLSAQELREALQARRATRGR